MKTVGAFLQIAIGLVMTAIIKLPTIPHVKKIVYNAKKISMKKTENAFQTLNSFLVTMLPLKTPLK